MNPRVSPSLCCTLCQALMSRSRYAEPRGDALNSSDATAATRSTEVVLRWLEGLTTAAKFDTVRDLAVHLGLQAWFRGRSAAGGARQTLLFDVVSDPEERRDRSGDEPDVVARLWTRAMEMAAARPPQQEYWMTVDRDTVRPCLPCFPDVASIGASDPT